MNEILFGIGVFLAVLALALVIPAIYALPHHPWVKIPKWPGRMYDRYLEWWLDKEMEWKRRDE